MKLALALVVTCFSLTACGDDILDWRNASVSGGKIYEGDSNSPFTGRLTNIPESDLPFDPVFNDIVVGFNDAMNVLNSRNQTIYGRTFNCDTYVDEGYLTGETSCHDRSGVTRWSATYGEGGIDDELKIFDTTGNKTLVIANFDKGVLDGTQRLYSPNNGELVRELHFKDGQAHGDQTRWAENGTKTSYYKAVNGHKTGVVTEWAPNGQKTSEIPYGDNGVHGVVRIWDAETGQLTRETTFVDGRAIGRQTTWNLDGSVKSDADIRADGSAVNLMQPTPVPEQEPASFLLNDDYYIDDCTSEWMTAFRREVGEDYFIKYDQFQQWNRMCEEGERP